MSENNLDLDELLAHVDQDHRIGLWKTDYGDVCVHDRQMWPCDMVTLVAEVRRLRDELKTIEANNTWYSHAFRDACDQRDDFHDELIAARKRAEAAEARIAAALELCDSHATCGEPYSCSPTQLGCSGITEIREALTGDRQTGETGTRPETAFEAPESHGDARNGVGADKETPEAPETTQAADRAAIADEIATALLERAERFPDKGGRWWDGWRAGLNDAADTALAHMVPPEQRKAYEDAIDQLVIGDGPAQFTGILNAHLGDTAGRQEAGQ